jgi:hypothetical protein
MGYGGEQLSRKILLSSCAVKGKTALQFLPHFAFSFEMLNSRGRPQNQGYRKEVLFPRGEFSLLPSLEAVSGAGELPPLRSLRTELEPLGSSGSHHPAVGFTPNCQCGNNSGCLLVILPNQYTALVRGYLNRLNFLRGPFPFTRGGISDILLIIKEISLQQSPFHH